MNVSDQFIYGFITGVTIMAIFVIVNVFVTAMESCP